MVSYALLNKYHHAYVVQQTYIILYVHVASIFLEDILGLLVFGFRLFPHRFQLPSRLGDISPHGSRPDNHTRPTLVWQNLSLPLPRGLRIVLPSLLPWGRFFQRPQAKLRGKLAILPLRFWL